MSQFDCWRLHAAPAPLPRDEGGNEAQPDDVRHHTAYNDEHMRDLPCKTIEADEIWSFVGSKAKNVPEGPACGRKRVAPTYHDTISLLSASSAVHVHTSP